MFNGLDEFDWEQWGDKHIAVGRNSKDIPEFFKQLFADEKEEREYAIMDLFGHGQHFGMIVPATPYIIRYALEVLEQDNYPEREYLLHAFASVARHIFYAGQSISQIKLAMQVYDELLKGYESYKNCLSHEDKLIRSNSVAILQHMQDKLAEVVVFFYQRLSNESENSIRAEIIEGMLDLLSNANALYSDIGSQYLFQMYELFKDRFPDDEKILFRRKLKSIRYYPANEEFRIFIHQS